MLAADDKNTHFEAKRDVTASTSFTPFPGTQ